MIIITLFWMLVPKKHGRESFPRKYARESREHLITLQVFGVVFHLFEEGASLRTALGRTMWG